MNEPMYTTEAELKQVMNLKPEGYPIPYFPDPERKESIDVLQWNRFPSMDMIFGVGAKDHPFREDFDFFMEIRLRDRNTNQIVGGKRWYLDKAGMIAMFRGISVVMGHHNLFTGNQIEKIERDSHALEPEQDGK